MPNQASDDEDGKVVTDSKTHLKITENLQPEMGASKLADIDFGKKSNSKCRSRKFELKS